MISLNSVSRKAFGVEISTINFIFMNTHHFFFFAPFPVIILGENNVQVVNPSHNLTSDFINCLNSNNCPIALLMSHHPHIYNNMLKLVFILNCPMIKILIVNISSPGHNLLIFTFSSSALLLYLFTYLKILKIFLCFIPFY